MANIYETIYPKFKNDFSFAELNEIYTPTDIEVSLADRVTERKGPKLCFLISLKCFQRLGYFILLSNVPDEIISHISKFLNITMTPLMKSSYNKSGTRLRHIQVIREFLGITPFNSKARHLIVTAIGKAAKTKEEPDLVKLFCNTP